MLFSRHARKHFSQAEGSQLDEVRQAMGMLAFPPDTHVSPYKVTGALGAALAQSRAPARPSRPRPAASLFCCRELGSEALSVVWPAGACPGSVCRLRPPLLRVPGPCLRVLSQTGLLPLALWTGQGRSRSPSPAPLDEQSNL